MLQKVTKGDLRREIMSVMPTSSSGGAGEVTAYLALIIWLLRAMVDEAAFAFQV